MRGSIKISWPVNIRGDGRRGRKRRLEDEQRGGRRGGGRRKRRRRTGGVRDPLIGRWVPWGQRRRRRRTFHKDPFEFHGRLRNKPWLSHCELSHAV